MKLLWIQHGVSRCEHAACIRRTHDGAHYSPASQSLMYFCSINRLQNYVIFLTFVMMDGHT